METKTDKIMINGLYYMGKTIHKADKILTGVGRLAMWTASTIVIDTLDGIAAICSVLANIVDPTDEITREEVKKIYESNKEDKTNEDTLESN